MVRVPHLRGCRQQQEVSALRLHLRAQKRSSASGLTAHCSSALHWRLSVAGPFIPREWTKMWHERAKQQRRTSTAMKGKLIKEGAVVCLHVRHSLCTSTTDLQSVSSWSLICQEAVSAWKCKCPSLGRKTRTKQLLGSEDCNTEAKNVCDVVPKSLTCVFKRLACLPLMQMLWCE